MSLVATTHVPKTPADAPRKAPPGADVVEVRLERLATGGVADALARPQAPVLATCRREADGATVALDEDERRERLAEAIGAGADLVDLERDAPFRDALADKARRANAHVIVSEHALDGTPTPDAMLDTLAAMREGADVVKLATRADEPADVDRLLEAARRAPTLGTPFALMGVGDRTLRGLAGPLGMALAYAAPEGAGVPGQLPARVQGQLPRAPPAPEPLEDLVLLGHPVEHSLSPPMHEAALRRLDVPARYRLVDVPPDRLEVAVEGLIAADALGGNATAPHKLALHELCDTVTPTAEACGAVNTVRVEDGTLHGTMTDGTGLVRGLRDAGEVLDGREVLLVGAGGTARAGAHALAEAGAELTLANRTPDKAEAIAADVGARTVPLDPDALGEATPEGGLVVNATPVDPPVPDGALARARAFDANYGARAAFAERARACGATTLDGLALLVGQGIPALAFWLDREVPDEAAGAMRTAACTGALEARYRRDTR